MLPGGRTRLEATRAVRFVQLTSKARLLAADSGEPEEAILETTRQQCGVLQILRRFPLGVEQLLHSLDDLVAASHEPSQELDMRRKRHWDATFCASAHGAQYWLSRIGPSNERSGA